MNMRVTFLMNWVIVHPQSKQARKAYQLDSSKPKPRMILEASIMWNCGEASMRAAEVDFTTHDSTIRGSLEHARKAQGYHASTADHAEFIHHAMVDGDSYLKFGDWENRQTCHFSGDQISASQAASLLPSYGYTVAACVVLDVSNRTGWGL
jgi:hypothetical protein